MTGDEGNKGQLKWSQIKLKSCQEKLNYWNGSKMNSLTLQRRECRKTTGNNQTPPENNGNKRRPPGTIRDQWKHPQKPTTQINTCACQVTCHEQQLLSSPSPEQTVPFTNVLTPNLGHRPGSGSGSRLAKRGGPGSYCEAVRNQPI